MLYRTILLVIAFISTPLMAEKALEVCLANDAGGEIVLTHEPCTGEKVNTNLFPFHAYATEASGTIHTGCYDIPSVADAKPSNGTKIIPLVNFVDVVDLQVITLKAEWFTPEACLEII
jgi:hypothetical protein